MQRPHLWNRQYSTILKSIILAVSILIGLTTMLSGWQPSFAQVTDWCSQPGLLWCTSHEEFNVGDNLNTGSNFGGQYISWYSGTAQTTAGYVDRNDYNYPNPPYSPQDVLNNLPATITQASTVIPARSGETSAKKFLSLWNNTSFGQPSDPTKQFSSGIFLTRKLIGGLQNYMNDYPNGLYYSA